MQKKIVLYRDVPRNPELRRKVYWAARKAGIQFRLWWTDKELRGLRKNRFIVPWMCQNEVTADVLASWMRSYDPLIMCKKKTMRATQDSWTVKVDGEKTTFSREDVAQYFGTNFGTTGVRCFGAVSGDWRMIDRIANDAQAYFDEQDEMNGKGTMQ